MVVEQVRNWFRRALLLPAFMVAISRNVAVKGRGRRERSAERCQSAPFSAASSSAAWRRPASGTRHVALLGSQRLQRKGLHIERRQQADLAQQQQLESTQRGGLGRGLRADVIACQHLNDPGVGIEQRFMGIVTRQQAQQQLVDVVARQQRLAGRHHMAAHPFGALERADFGVAAVVELQRLQRQQHRPKVRTRPLRPLGHERNAPVVAGELRESGSTRSSRSDGAHRPVRAKRGGQRPLHS